MKKPTDEERVAFVRNHLKAQGVWTGDCQRCQYPVVANRRFCVSCDPEEPR